MSAVVEGDGGESNNTPTNEYIASFVWNAGHLCAAYYNTTSLELFVTYETVDFKPNFLYLKNLFRQMTFRSVLASGPHQFLTTIMELLEMPDRSPDLYRQNRLKTLSTAKFIVYTSTEKSVISNRMRIFELALPRMPQDDQSRRNFIETILPLHQPLVVESLGNLLAYLDSVWRHLFVGSSNRPVFSDLHIHRLNQQMLIDDATFKAMQVFASEDHPSAFKKMAHKLGAANDDGLSLFSIMNTCVSRSGANQLRLWLYQPIRNVNELQSRYLMIEWLRNEKNALLLTKFSGALKKISDAGETYAKLLNTRGKPTHWRTFKKSLFYAKQIADICIELVESKVPGIKDTLIETFGEYATTNKVLENILNYLDAIMDLKQSLNVGKFCVNSGLDPELDKQKEKLQAMADELQAKTNEDLEKLPSYINEFAVHYIHELGLLIAIPMETLDEQPPDLEAYDFKFVMQGPDAFYYQTKNCYNLTNEYSALYVEICEREQQICERMLDHIHDRMADIQHASQLCAQLDCLMAMATFSKHHNLVKPQLLTDQRTMTIKNGRHILLEKQGKFIGTDTNIDVERKNLINVLIAPNASGKSVYMKQLAQITYLAHVGSFVPATKAVISVVDAIYTRMYNPESLYLGKSAYMIELQQMCNVVENSTSSSLLLVDEMGQGTNENDGKSLLLGSIRHLAGRGALAPITIITTHYVDIYDMLVGEDWIVFKTFKMEPSANGGLQSTFKLIDGRCADQYAKDCSVIRRFMKQTNVSSDTSSDKQSTTSDGKTAEPIALATKVSSWIYNGKIMCAAAMLKHFLQGTNSGESLTEVFERFRIYDLDDPKVVAE